MPLLYSGLRRHLALRVRTRRPGPVDYGRQNHGRQGSAGHQDDHSSIIFRKCGCRFLAYSRHTPRTPYLLHDPGACPALTILFRFLSPVVALLVPRRRCLFRDSFLAACESPTAPSCASSVHSAPGDVTARSSLMRVPVLHYLHVHLRSVVLRSGGSGHVPVAARLPLPSVAAMHVLSNNGSARCLRLHPAPPPRGG